MKPHYLISLVSLTLMVFGCSPSEQESEGAASAEETNLYMGAPVTLVEAPNGAIHEQANGILE